MEMEFAFLSQDVVNLDTKIQNSIHVFIYYSESESGAISITWAQQNTCYSPSNTMCWHDVVLVLGHPDTQQKMYVFGVS